MGVSGGLGGWICMMEARSVLKGRFVGGGREARTSLYGERECPLLLFTDPPKRGLSISVEQRRLKGAIEVVAAFLILAMSNKNKWRGRMYRWTDQRNR